MDFSENGHPSLYASTLKKALEIVRRRIDESGTKEPLIQSQGLDRILVQRKVDDLIELNVYLERQQNYLLNCSSRIRSNELTNLVQFLILYFNELRK